MTTRKPLGKRITSMFLVLSLLMTMLPLIAPSTIAATATGDRVADPSTMDSWKDYFSISGDISNENAGGVWVDKSVFTDASAFAGTGITQSKTDSFLVALSTMAANMSITGVSHVPTDTILVLDVSGSMSDNYSDVAEELVDAANESIATLLEANRHNRVGVVLYSGSTTGNNYNGAAITVLPLDRYTTGSHGRYLQYTITGTYSTTETISVNKDVRISGTTKAPPSASKNVVGSTYIQRGIVTAMEAFIAKDNDIIVEDPIWGTLHRKPVLVLMSDGSPTLGSVDFTDPGYDSYYEYELGDGLDTSPAIGFVSQLTAAYAKAKIQEKYDAKPLFYTLGLGVSGESIATGVLDPQNKDASPELGKLWDQYQAEGASSVKVSSYYKVNVIDTPLDRNYVDKYFAADGTSGSLSAALAKAFREIVGTIQLQTMYFPTMVDDSEQLSGYVSFVDKIGQYMEVTDIKGILIDNKLFSGADLASNFVPGGGTLGTYDAPTELGIEMVAAVRARLGIDSDDAARALIGLAYEHGQLSYTDKNNFSNYIGWYANQAGDFLGFYHEGTTVLPAATGNPDTDPAFLVKSYGYLGAVDQEQGVAKSDMMYATVQIREEIATGKQLVTFAVPAALIPVVSYHVKLDGNDALEDLTVEGADAPIRLVYEVALDPSINSFNVKDVLSQEYLADPHHINADGTVNFYTSQWDHQNTTGYGTVNTYSYFNPSKQNDKYYYQVDAPVYTDTQGTLYTGDAQPSAEDTLYRTYTIYERSSKGVLSTRIVYRPLSDAAKATAIRAENGSWYIPMGNIHVNLDGYTVPKTENTTETLTDVNIPFVDTHNHTVDDWGYYFYVGASLGNNGKFTLIPQSGLRLSKTMADGVAAPGTPFTFYIYNETNTIDSNTYPAWIAEADGTQHDTSVTFVRGKATVTLEAGEILYIGGMTIGHTLRIEEQETLEYSATVTGLSQSGTVTVTENLLAPVDFVNDIRGTGNLTISKNVEHDFGADYSIPADKIFTVQVTLSGIGTANTTFNTTAGTVTTDGNGQFTVQLRHGQQCEIMDLPTGTIAVVEELNPSAGFTPTYWEDGILDDGEVTIFKASTVSVVVVNDYEPKPVQPSITVSGEKILNGRDWQQGDSFSFLLEKRCEDGSWQQLGNIATATYGSTGFDFADAFKDEIYTQSGIYDYRITEMEPNVPLGGIAYDKTVYTFCVHVTDTDMDGQLEIQNVSSNTATVTALAGSWNVDATFTNTYSVNGSATVTIDVTKHIENIGGAEKSLAGFTFGLFDTNGSQVGQSLSTDAQGFVQFTLNYNASEIGNGNHSYTYVLKEIAPNPVPAGWTYSKDTVTVKVDVTDNGDGTISAVIYTGNEKPANAGTSITASFTNIYDPADAELIIDFVNKELIGKELTNGEFEFEVQAPDGSTILKGTNDASGKVTFNGKLEFNAVGTYIYNVVETSQDGNGIVTDKTVHRVTVTVTDVNGKLEADYALISGDTITFRNTYTAGSVDHTIRGNKTLRGRPLLNDEFTFILTDGSQSWTTKNFADGTFVFPVITYTEAGSYVYTVEEDIPQGGTYGITYDRTQYTVTVVVKDDGEGNLYVASETVTDGDSLHFLNSYAPAPTHTQFTGDKQLIGKVSNTLQGGEFAFVLYNSDANWTLGTVRETVRNDANGAITFRKIDFNQTGDQYFVVAEQNGGQTIDGITYDDTVYRVWVEVTDDLKGQLHATVHIYDANGVPQNRISFQNIYQVTGGAAVTLSGEKSLEGRDFNGDDSFSFRLYDTEDLYAIAQMDPVTHRYQFTLNYTPADIGRTFHYTLKETNGGETIHGITYSNTEYRIEVAVEDDGKGGIRTTVTIDDATVSTLDFVNKYEAAPTDIVLNGTKELSGQALKNEAFTFLLTETDETYTALPGVTPLVAHNGADGTFSFAKIDLTAAGDRYFVVVEQNGGQTIDGITYDDTVYQVWVEVTDDLKGQLHATVHISDSDSIIFRNIYRVTGEAAVTLSGEKHLEGRDFLADDSFTFLLYRADGSFITAGMDPVTHRYQFNLSYTAADVGQTFSYTLKETHAGETIDGVTYSDMEYRIQVSVEDNGKGGIRTAVTTNHATTSTLDFVNKYRASQVHVAINGVKNLSGRDLADGEFRFFMVETDGTFTAPEGVAPTVAYNDADGSFTFNTRTFAEVGTYYFVITEDNTVDAERVTFDDAVYHVTIQVTDDLQGKLVANVSSVKVGSTDSAEIIGFHNVFTPRPEDITVDILVNKVVNNTGTEQISPEGFTFLLDDGTQTSTVLSDADGKAIYTLTFTEDDLGKTFHYTLTEVNCGKEHVTYSTAVYSIDITISLDEQSNTLVATLVQNQEETDTLVASFENVYHLVIEEEIPVTGNEGQLVQWIALVVLSSGAVLALLIQDQKRRNKHI